MQTVQYFIRKAIGELELVGLREADKQRVQRWLRRAMVETLTGNQEVKIKLTGKKAELIQKKKLAVNLDDHRVSDEDLQAVNRTLILIGMDYGG